MERQSTWNVETDMTRLVEYVAGATDQSLRKAHVTKLAGTVNLENGTVGLAKVYIATTV